MDQEIPTIILEPLPPEGGRRRKIIIAIAVIALVIIGLFAIAKIWGDTDEPQQATQNQPEAVVELKVPGLTTTEIVTGHSNIWDMVLVDNKTMLFDERGGGMHAVNTETKEKWQVTTVPKVLASGEGGLLGLALDNEFETNRYVYACYNSTGATRSVRVTRFSLSQSNRSASGFKDIITDIESQAGRHSGCRMRMDKDNVLWIGTGDSALSTAPQNPQSLGGKVLRVDRDGKAAIGNMGAPFDSRIYNYGHRNIQGLVLFDKQLPNGAIGLTAEHGPDKEDEINWIKQGNFGWDPNTGTGRYDESVKMTDKTRFPDAIDAVWNSGPSTIAVSGLAVLGHERWSQWQGYVAMAVLKDKHVRLLDIDDDGNVKVEQEILTNFGRVRALTEAPNGDLYVSTDNGNGADKIIRVSPK